MAAQDMGNAEKLALAEHDSLEHWQSVLEQRPNFSPALIGMTRALAALDKSDEILALAEQQVAHSPRVAEWIMRVAAKAMPRTPEIGLAYCKMMSAAGDWPKATVGWGMLRRQFARIVDVHIGFIDCMLQQHLFDEAERAASRALKFFKISPPLLAIHARVAEERGDWTLAEQRWQLVAKNAPHDEQAAANHRHALEQAERGGFQPVQNTATGIAVPSVTPDQNAAVKDLLMGFESMGFNCEFGLLQRAFNAEPIGLLRFSATRPVTMLKLLRTRFAGMGEIDDMKLVRGRKDYQITHRLTDWTMHTQVRPSPGLDEVKLMHDQVKRAKYLSRKLIDDLEEQNKIFVFQKFDLKDADIDAIYAAMEVYGPNRLMCVRVADQTRPAGSVEWRSDRLMVCAIDRKGSDFPGGGWDISKDYWIYFCRLAQERWGHVDNTDALEVKAA